MNGTEALTVVIVMNVAGDVSQPTNIDNDASCVEECVDATVPPEAVQDHQDIPCSCVVPITVGVEITHTQALHLGFFLVGHRGIGIVMVLI